MYFIFCIYFIARLISSHTGELIISPEAHTTDIPNRSTKNSTF